MLEKFLIKLSVIFGRILLQCLKIEKCLLGDLDIVMFVNDVPALLQGFRVFDNLFCQVRVRKKSCKCIKEIFKVFFPYLCCIITYISEPMIYLRRIPGEICCKE